jgi:hypothetical protein
MDRFKAAVKSMLRAQQGNHVASPGGDEGIYDYLYLKHASPLVEGPTWSSAASCTYKVGQKIEVAVLSTERLIGAFVLRGGSIQAAPDISTKSDSRVKSAVATYKTSHLTVCTQPPSPTPSNR